MRILLTNAHKNPIILDCPWMFAEDEEAIAVLKPRESINFDVGGSEDRDPRHVVVFGIQEDGEFYVDVHTEDEGPERVWSWKDPDED